MVVIHERLVVISSTVPSQDNIVDLKTQSITALSVNAAAVPSPDFH
jgi:hypothetical protein